MNGKATKGEAYLDIVWRQFRKNRAALISLWLIVPVFLVAIFAPLLASDQPLVFHDGEQTIFPWFRALFNPGNTVDYVYNMALVGFIPWAVLSIGLNYGLRRKGISGAYRALMIAGLFVANVTLLSLSFLTPGAAPSNTYRSRTFPEEQFRSGGERSGIFVPIPFGPIEQDNLAFFKPPMFRKPPDQWRESNDGFPHLL